MATPQPQPPSTQRLENYEEHLIALAQVESDRLQALADCVVEYEAEIAKIDKSYTKRIALLVADEAESQAELHNAIVDAPEEMFAKKKSRVVGTCKFGWKKQRGKVVISDDASAIERLIKVLGKDEAEQHINRKASVNKTSVAKLPGATLKKIGVTIEQDTETVFVKSTTSDLAEKIEKLRDSSLVDVDA